METTDLSSLFRREGRRTIFFLGLFLNSGQASKFLLVRDSIWSIAHVCLCVTTAATQAMSWCGNSHRAHGHSCGKGGKEQGGGFVT